MKKQLTILLLLISGLAYSQETLILDKVKPVSWNATVPAVIFRSNPDKGLPLVIFCHGVGEIGSDGLKLWNQGLPLVLKNGFRPPYPVVVVAPQFTSWMNPASIPYIIQDMVTRFGIDTNRIYITGLSAGGYTTWGSITNVSQALANKIAAIVPLSASVSDVIQANVTYFKQSKTPVWAIVGGSTTDNTETSFREGNIDLVNKVNLQVPGLAKISIRPGVGHGGWVEIYNGTWKENGLTIWDFLKDKKTGTAPPPVVTPPVVTPPVTTGLTYAQIVKIADSLQKANATPVVKPLYLGVDKKLYLDSSLQLKITAAEAKIKALEEMNISIRQDLQTAIDRQKNTLKLFMELIEKLNKL